MGLRTGKDRGSEQWIVGLAGGLERAEEGLLGAAGVAQVEELDAAGEETRGRCALTPSHTHLTDPV
ncbi:hypothetical protein [Streptomyces sp. NPDC093984]|uniref:hypothetical protein n=1 Tax=Streptomyces sp. NPDC093984 TaxID=3366052 RepID=UPI003800EDE3